jgi:hypothetical protein
MRYDRGRQSLDRHATYIVAAFVAGAAANPRTAVSGDIELRYRPAPPVLCGL